MKFQHGITMLLLAVATASAQTNTFPSGIVYSSGDGVPWWINGQGNGPAILLQKHGGVGGTSARRGSLGWMDNGGTKYEVLTWTQDYDGRVGIGTAAPHHKLTVVGGNYNYQPTIGLYATTQSGNAATRNWALLANYTGYGDFGIIQSNAQDGDPVSMGTTRLYCDPSGNIGIGTTSPLKRLHVTSGSSGAANYGVDGIAIETTGHSSLQFMGPGNAQQGLTFSDPGMVERGFLYYKHDSNDMLFATNGSERLRIDALGNVGIGTISPTEKLSVNGKIRAKEVIVETTGWSDHVFADSYQLQSLAEVEQHIKAEKHLPGVPSAQEVADKGVSVGDMQAILLAKIEELTLHQIAQEKEITRLRESEKALIALRAEVHQLQQKQ